MCVYKGNIEPFGSLRGHMIHVRLLMLCEDHLAHMRVTCLLSYLISEEGYLSYKVVHMGYVDVLRSYEVHLG